MTDNRDQARTSALETRYGHVDGARRFKIEHWDLSSGNECWRAADLLAPEGSHETTFDGTHEQCVEWAWRRGA